LRFEFSERSFWACTPLRRAVIGRVRGLLKEEREERRIPPEPFFQQPARTNCPYLVGSYATVASELAAYMTARVRTFILDIPHNEEEFEHISIVFRRAMETLTVSA
jgi:alkanesulfonate monooxygenase SsuD/methylene tetrahydromethanopterin reductase-like flavin-dependent oxidoreductase (luciferase family)